VMGLAIIGTEEAIALVFSLDPEKNRYYPREMRWNFDLINIK